jgi:class 3 adenylate cyclase/tetratricopeptide (TPR) repeat protein/DNA polymerase III delta prime subunit
MEPARRRTVSILFTDLVGSTDLLYRLGEQAAGELRHTHDRLVRSAITAHNGDVANSTGDGVMAVFEAASDAVEAAVTIQREFSWHNRSGSEPMHVRVGIAVGDVTIEGSDVFGSAVVAAARLCNAAVGDQILCSDLVEAVARLNVAFDFGSVGELTLKGLPAPVAAYEIAWDVQVASDLPLPPLLDGGDPLTYVGRFDEREIVTRAWKQAATGRLGVVLVRGESGVGKTRLAAELAREVVETGGFVLAGRCDEDLGVPYQPFVEALRWFVEHCPEPERSRALRGSAEELARLVPELAAATGGPAPAPPDPDTERYRLFEAVGAWLAAASETRPMLLVLDDLQWARKPTTLLVRYLTRSRQPTRLLILATYRDTELGPHQPLTELLADLRRDGSIQRIRLEGLAHDDVHEWLRFVSAAPLPAGAEATDAAVDLARFLCHETAGNPFFIGELIAHLGETGLIDQVLSGEADTLALERSGVPESIREVVGHRLARLSPETNELLSMASVMGSEFELPVLRAAVGDSLDLDRALDEALARGVIAELGGEAVRFRFAHLLVRATIYDDLRTTRRLALHRRVGEAIEQVHGLDLSAHLSELAHHFGHAAVGGEASAHAIDYLIAAGDRARDALAFEEAVRHYERAVELIGSGSDDTAARRAALLVALGTSAWRAGERGRCQPVLAEAAALARSVGDPELVAQAAVGAAMLNGSLGYGPGVAGTVDRETVELIEEALARLPDTDSPLRARLLAALAWTVYWSSSTAARRDLSDAAIAMAERCGDVPALLAALGSKRAAVGPSGAMERLRATRAVLELAESHGAVETVLEARLLTAMDLLELGDVEAFDRETDRFLEQVRERRVPHFEWYARVVDAMRAMLQGRFADAETIVEEAAAIGTAVGDRATAALHGAQLLWLWRERGRTAELTAAMDAILETSSAIPATRVGLMLVATELSDLERARAEVDSLAAGDFGGIPLDLTWLPGMAIVALTVAGLDDATRAEAVYAQLLPYAGRNVVVWSAICFGPVSYYLGLLATTAGRFDDACGHFDDALAMAQSLGARPFVARTQLGLAAALAGSGRGDAVRVRELAAAARATARELGMPSLEAAAEGRLSRL